MANMNGGDVDLLAVQVDGCTAKNRQTGSQARNKRSSGYYESCFLIGAALDSISCDVGFNLIGKPTTYWQRWWYLCCPPFQSSWPTTLLLLFLKTHSKQLHSRLLSVESRRCNIIVILLPHSSNRLRSFLFTGSRQLV